MNDQTTPKNHQLTRRNFARGTAWSIPAITVAASAPAVAASGLPPTLSAHGHVTYNEYYGSSDVDDSQDYKLYATAAGSDQPGPGYCIANTKTSTTISDLTVTFWLPKSGLTFFTGPDGSSAWTQLSADATQPAKSSSGVTYYPYTTKYTASIPAVNGTTCVPGFEFESIQSFATQAGSFFTADSAVINGTKQAQAFGPIAMS